MVLSDFYCGVILSVLDLIFKLLLYCDDSVFHFIFLEIIFSVFYFHSFNSLWLISIVFMVYLCYVLLLCLFCVCVITYMHCNFICRCVFCCIAS